MAWGFLPDGGGRHADLGPDPVKAIFAGSWFPDLLVVLLLFHVWRNFHCVVGHPRDAAAHTARAKGINRANAGRGRERAFGGVIPNLSISFTVSMNGLHRIWLLHSNPPWQCSLTHPGTRGFMDHEGGPLACAGLQQIH